MVIAYLLSDMPKSDPAAIQAAKRKLSGYTLPQLEKMLEKKYRNEGSSITFHFRQSGTPKNLRWQFRIWAPFYPSGYDYDLRKDWLLLEIWGPKLPVSASNEELAHAAGILAKRFGFTKKTYPNRYMQVSRKGKGNDTDRVQIMTHQRSNPVSKGDVGITDRHRGFVIWRDRQGYLTAVGPMGASISGQIRSATTMRRKIDEMLKRDKDWRPKSNPSDGLEAFSRGSLGQRIYSEIFKSGSGKIHVSLIQLPGTPARYDLHIHPIGQQLYPIGPLTKAQAKSKLKKLKSALSK